MTHLASSLVVSSALVAVASLGTPTAAVASDRAITQGPIQQVTTEYTQYRAIVMQDRASDIIGAATIGVGLWLPVQLSGSLVEPPRLPPLRVITAHPTATRHLDTATRHPHMDTVRVAPYFGC